MTDSVEVRLVEHVAIVFFQWDRVDVDEKPAVSVLYVGSGAGR